MLLIWGFMVMAKFAEYDKNYGYAIYAFFLSLFITIAIVFFWFKYKTLIKLNGFITILFLITSSPLTLFLFIELYGRFIGQYFKL
jgi:hypothetical protein